MKRAVVLLSVGAVLAAVGCRKGTSVTDSTIGPCKTFAGGKLTARWTDCSDKVQRELSCSMSVEQLKCDCLEDGAMKTFFFAKNPPLETRADATRVANANCRWSLE